MQSQQSWSAGPIIGWHFRGSQRDEQRRKYKNKLSKCSSSTVKILLYIKYHTYCIKTISTLNAILAFRKIGGYEELKLKFMNATPTLRPPNSTCGYPPDDAFHMFHHATSDNMPWPGMLVGLTIIGIWYWCTDQV